MKRGGVKKGGIKVVSLMLLIAFFFPFTLSADESTKNIVSKVLETFDPDTMTAEWVVQGSKFITEGYPKYKMIDGFPYALYGRQGEEENHQVLGILGKFDRKGYNYLEIIPVEDGPDGKVPKKITMPGRVLEMDMWVWGGNWNYTLEVFLEDYRGIVHVLELGRLKYTGWKNLRISLPTYIPQSEVYIPKYKELKLLKFVLRTEPEEDVSGFELYIDHIKLLTDMFESRFDGDEFVRPEKRAEIWPEEEE